MKKALKIIAIVLLLGGLIALGICYYVMPIKTTMAFDKVIALLNTPVGIIGGTTITLGLVGAIVLKVVLDLHRSGIRHDLNEIKKLREEKTEEAKHYYELALKEKEEVKTIITSNKDQIDFLVAKIVKICETTPNAKVQALAKEILEGYNNGQKQLEEELHKVDTSIEEYVQEKVDTKDLLAKYNELLNLLGKLEIEYGKGTND